MTEIERPHVRWAKGGEARLLEAGNDKIVLLSSVPSPPGSRIDGVLLGDFTATLRLKVHGSVRLPDGAFRIEGRPLDLTRELRERLKGLVEPA